MNTPVSPRGFPLPSSLKVVPGTERAQAAYPYHIQFSEADDNRFWFYNSMHFPEPMSAFDMVTAEAAYCALGSSNTRVHSLPTTLGIDHRIINGRVYIGGNAAEDDVTERKDTNPSLSITQRRKSRSARSDPQRPRSAVLRASTPVTAFWRQAELF
jgi:hypothetical protein